MDGAISESIVGCNGSIIERMARIHHPDYTEIKPSKKLFPTKIGHVYVARRQ